MPGDLILLAQLCAWFVILCTVFIPLEQFFALRPQKIRRPQFLNDLGFFFLSGLMPKLILAIPMAALAFGFNRILPSALLAFTAQLPLWAKLLGSLTLGEIGFYWGHRWMHEIPFLWRFHALHHSAEKIDFMVNTRLHPIDLVFTRLCGFVPIYALGFAAPTTHLADNTPLMFILFGVVWGFFLHANIRARFGPIEKVIAMPAFHHWHHSKVDHANHNYASVFAWLDRIFGTYYLPDEWPAEYGIVDKAPEDFASQILEPFDRKP